MDRLKDKVAVVTGAGSGIGRASSTLFARNGAKIIVADIDKGKGEIVAESIRSAAGDALAVEVDVGDSASVQAMVAQAEDHFGGIDLLFTNALNAGLVNNSDACALELEESVFDEIQRVALGGFFCVPNTSVLPWNDVAVEPCCSRRPWTLRLVAPPSMPTPQPKAAS